MDVKVYLKKYNKCIDVLHNVMGIAERFGTYVITVNEEERLTQVYYSKWEYRIEAVQ